jgi:hypothetical protein
MVVQRRQIGHAPRVTVEKLLNRLRRRAAQVVLHCANVAAECLVQMAYNMRPSDQHQRVFVTAQDLIGRQPIESADIFNLSLECRAAHARHNSSTRRKGQEHD